MPLVNQTFEYLPDIDADISAEQLASIKASLLSHIPADASSTPHPSLPAAYEPSFSELIQHEHARLAAGTPKSSSEGIDSSRYESLSAPSDNAPESWKETLQRAYAAHTHLSIRAANLSLLEEFGRNAWLIANGGLEAELAALEKEVAAATADAQAVEAERWAARQEVKGEFEILDETWRRGVGRAIEAEIAGEEVRRAILSKRREGAGNATTSTDVSAEPGA